MCRRSEILSATEIVTKIPDEIPVSQEEVRAIATVLRLLSTMLPTATD